MFAKRFLPFAIAVFLSHSSFAFAEELTPAKAADIRELLKVTGIVDAAMTFGNFTFQNMADTIKAARPDIPHRYFEILHEELNIVLEKGLMETGGLMDEIIAVYNKYFTHKEIKGLLEFYETELGKKTIRIMPKLMNESGLITQRWTQLQAPKISENVRRRCKEEGIEIPKFKTHQ
jgi:hypothetical protein